MKLTDLKPKLTSERSNAISKYVGGFLVVGYFWWIKIFSTDRICCMRIFVDLNLFMMQCMMHSTGLKYLQLLFSYIFKRCIYCKLKNESNRKKSNRHIWYWNRIESSFKWIVTALQTNILTKFESSLQESIPVIAAKCSIRERNVKNQRNSLWPWPLM